MSPDPALGHPLAPHDQFRILAAFRGRYRVREYPGTLDRPGWLEPTWGAFPPESVPCNPGVLSGLDLPAHARLLVIAERPYPGCAYRAPLSAVRAFLDATPDAEWHWTQSHYVLPEDLSWCVAFTDESAADGRYVLRIGTVPTRDQGGPTPPDLSPPSLGGAD